MLIRFVFSICASGIKAISESFVRRVGFSSLMPSPATSCVDPPSSLAAQELVLLCDVESEASISTFIDPAALLLVNSASIMATISAVDISLC